MKAQTSRPPWASSISMIALREGRDSLIRGGAAMRRSPSVADRQLVARDDLYHTSVDLK